MFTVAVFLNDGISKEPVYTAFTEGSSRVVDTVKTLTSLEITCLWVPHVQVIVTLTQLTGVIDVVRVAIVTRGTPGLE